MVESFHLDIKRVARNYVRACIPSSTVEGVCGLPPLATVEERIWMQLLTCFNLLAQCEGSLGGGGGG